jgi:SSS family solute:Na+ symporter
MIAMLAVGLYFFNKKQNSRRFYVSGRNMSSWHIGLSVVATDVGGGFQLASDLDLLWDFCSWMLFTGQLLVPFTLFQRLAILDTNINFSLFHKSSVISMTDGCALAGIISAIDM